LKHPVYLDNAATTPVDPRVVEKLLECLGPEGVFGNPASRSHAFGWEAEEMVEEARSQLADLVGCDPREIIWTSGATEADNLAVKGAALAARRAGRGRHIVTSAIEHKAVLDSCEWLAAEGFEVTWLPPDGGGVIRPEQVAESLRADTVLVSLMHVNNEIGTRNDIAALGEVVREHGSLFHVDAAQSLAREPLDLARLPVDLMAFSGHKIYGPKGVGALYIRRDPAVAVEAQIHGGGHERGFRSGTLASHQIVAMGEAARILEAERVEEAARIGGLAERLRAGLQTLDGVRVNGDPQRRAPGIVNASFEGVDGETLLMAIAADVACSSGSACTSATVEPSYVLRALGLPDALAHASIRFSVGRFTREQEVDYAIERVTETVRRLRAASTAPRAGAAER